MWRRVLGFGLLAVISALACGGRVEGGETGSGETAPTKTSMPAATATSSASSPGSWSREYSIPDRPCAWVAENRCYDTREMACNCACPRSRNSECASGFDDGPDGHVWVACN